MVYLIGPECELYEGPRQASIEIGLDVHTLSKAAKLISFLSKL